MSCDGRDPCVRGQFVSPFALVGGLGRTPSAALQASAAALVTPSRVGARAPRAGKAHRLGGGAGAEGWVSMFAHVADAHGSAMVRDMGSEELDPAAVSAEAPSFVSPKAQRDILVHAVLTGLTPLIPIPFMDGWALARVQARMARRIGEAHGVDLSEAEARVLGKETGRSLGILDLPKKLAFYPVKRIFRTVLFVLVIKDMADATSHTYRVGYLLDHAFSRGWANLPASTLRSAVDDVCRRVDTAPLRRAIRSMFERSRDLLRDAVRAARAWAGNSAYPGEVDAVADRLGEVLQALPREHFEKLRAELDREIDHARWSPRTS